MAKPTLEEMLEAIKRLLALPRWNYSYKPNEWFFPSDLIPHSAKLKAQCKKLYENGLLERRGDGCNRWGYSYRVKAE